MKCACGGESVVTQTRTPVTGGLRRRRKCLSCGRLWSTEEVTIESRLKVPPELHREYKKLRNLGVSRPEAAKALGIKLD